MHFAVALQDLDVKVRVNDGSGWTNIEDGKVNYPGPQGDLAFYGPNASKGQPVYFSVSGPDIAAAMPIIKRVFEDGPRNHLAVVRRYYRLLVERGHITEGEYEVLETPGETWLATGRTSTAWRHHFR